MEPPGRFPEIGEKLANRFRIVFGRGSGPNGVVFKALDLALDLPVALKVFKPQLFTSSYKDQNLLRLYRARAYQDPNLVKIFEVQEDRGVHFISFQLMEGMSLAAILDLHAESGEHFTIPKVRSIFTRILKGLEAIHAQGTIHGNLKPQNIFILPERLVLSDPYYLVVETLKEGEVIPVWDYYRGPEQLTDPSLEIPQTDLFAAALIFGELVGGNPVRPGIPLSHQIPRLTTRLDDWFVKATATDPLVRWRTLQEFSEVLNGLLDLVESEGLWQRRYHETGSFRAIRVPLPRDGAIEPVIAKPEPTIGATPAVIAPIPPQPVQEAPPVAAEEPIPPAEEALEQAPVTEEVTVYEQEPVREVAPTPELEPTKEVAVPISEPVVEEVAVVQPLPDEEGIFVEPEPTEEAIEGIEVVSDEAPPIPIEAVTEDEQVLHRPLEVFDEAAQGQKAWRVEAPEVRTEPLIEGAPQPAVLPEARGDTLEIEQAVQPPLMPTTRMAPMQRVAGAPEAARPLKKAEAPPIRSLLLLSALFVVVLGVSVFAVLWLGQEPTPPSSATSEPIAPPPAPAALGSKDVPTVTAPDALAAAGGDTAPTVAPQPPPPPPPPPPKRTLAEVLSCPEGMAKVVLDAEAPEDADPRKVAFCIATHEYPGAGQRPKAGVSAATARSLCAKEGKRLCTGEEWRAACGRVYPYGAEYREGACNVTSGVLKESGSYPECKTKAGVFDLVGNASEWAADGRVHGGDASGGADNRCDTWSKRLMPGPMNGFRCCADATR